MSLLEFVRVQWHLGMSDLRLFNCIEKKGKFKIPWRISSFVLLRCRIGRPMKELVRFVMTIIFSLNVMSPTWNCDSTVTIGVPNCPLATIIWNSGGGPSFNTVCVANNRTFRRSASGMAPDKTPVSMSPSMFNSPNSIRNKAFCVSFLMANLLIAGETFWIRLVLPGPLVKFGRQWLVVAFVGFVVSAESSVMLMYRVNVGSLSRNLSMHILVRLIHVHPESSHHFQFGH